LCHATHRAPLQLATSTGNTPAASSPTIDIRRQYKLDSTKPLEFRDYQLIDTVPVVIVLALTIPGCLFDICQHFTSNNKWRRIPAGSFGLGVSIHSFTTADHSTCPNSTEMHPSHSKCCHNVKMNLSQSIVEKISFQLVLQEFNRRQLIIFSSALTNLDSHNAPEK
jgi:hypothetical protein